MVPHCDEIEGESQVDLSVREIVALLNKYLVQFSCLFLFSGIFSGLRQAFPAFSDPLSVCAGVLEEEGGGRFLIREQPVSRKWLFGTGCSAEVGSVYGADAVRSVRSIQFMTTSLLIKSGYVSEGP